MHSRPIYVHTRSDLVLFEIKSESIWTLLNSVSRKSISVSKSDETRLNFLKFCEVFPNRSDLKKRAYFILSKSNLMPV